MSRLQVGGLAIIINDEIKSNIGKVVYLSGFHEQIECDLGMLHHDQWELHCADGVLCLDGSIMKYDIIADSKNLKPIDSNADFELRKEECEV